MLLEVAFFGYTLEVAYKKKIKLINFKLIKN